jgi:glycerol-3-phosphate acyltransferase PlsY
MDYPIFIALSFLIAGIPTAYLAGKILKGKDIRRVGDGNVGAGNAYRELGALIGIGVFTLDVAKGFLIISIVRYSVGNESLMLSSGIAAVLGHSFSIFLRFRGGRGEAVAIGVLIAILGWPALICTSIGILCLAIFKKVILASASGFIPLPAVCWAYGIPALLILYSVLLPVQVGIIHFLRVHSKRILHPA